MPNHLSIPFKQTLGVDIKKAIEEYFDAGHLQAHPDAFAWDIGHWAALRVEASSTSVHQSKIDVLLRYHAQLVFTLTKLPPNIGLSIAYSTPFSSFTPPGINNILLERTCVLFNLAALYSQLAIAENRSSSEGLKRALNNSQSSAGVLNYLRANVLPKLQQSLEHGHDIPPDLSGESLQSLELLMLAQAQESAWQRAVLDNLKNGVIAKLATKAAQLYTEAAKVLQDSPSTVRRAFPASWVAHLEAKSLHFEAAAQFRKSIDDLDARRYGHELTRLHEAHRTASKAVDVARRGGVAAAVVQDVRGLLSTLDTAITRAERDNDLIYHQDVPPLAAIDEISPASLVKSTPPAGLLNPQAVLEKADEGVIFGDLMSWGAREAINIYTDRKKNWVDENVIARAHDLDLQASNMLEELHLPAALDALDKPIGLPPSLLKKAEEVRLEDGPRRIDAMLADIQTLSKHVSAMLEEGLDAIDNAVQEGDTSQDPLVAKYEKYRNVLGQATTSDEITLGLWEEWEQRIVDLAQDEAVIEASVPSTTQKAATANRETKLQSRALRRLLESLDDVQRERADSVRRARQLADADDIQPRIAQDASYLARWTEVKPAMFEDTLEAELRKFEKFKRDVEDGAEAQDGMLRDLAKHNAAFLQSREDDPRVHQRQQALQDLDVAYHKYKEVIAHLVEGHQFYNGLADIFSKFKQECQDWAAHWLADSASAAAVAADEQNTYTEYEEYDTPLSPQAEPPVAQDTQAMASPQATAHIQARRAPDHSRSEPGTELPTSPRTIPALPSLPPPSRASGIRLPPPGSDDWQAVDFEAAVKPTPVKKTKKKTKVAM